VRNDVVCVKSFQFFISSESIEENERRKNMNELLFFLLEFQHLDSPFSSLESSLNIDERLDRFRRKCGVLKKYT